MTIEKWTVSKTRSLGALGKHGLAYYRLTKFIDLGILALWILALGISPVLPIPSCVLVMLLAFNVPMLWFSVAVLRCSYMFSCSRGRCSSALVLRCFGGQVLCCAALALLYFLILWPLVLWCFGALLLRCFVALMLCRAALVLCSRARALELL